VSVSSVSEKLFDFYIFKELGHTNHSCEGKYLCVKQINGPVFTKESMSYIDISPQISEGKLSTSFL
jgi:hypothetical protein